MRLATNSSAGCAVSSSGGPDLVQLPVADHADAVGQRAGVEEVVGDDQRRDAQAREDVRRALRARRCGCARPARRAARRAAGPSGRGRGRGRRRRAGVRRRRAGSASRARGARCAGARAVRSRAASLAPPKATLAATVMCGKSAYSWKTSPTERRSGGRSIRALRVQPDLVAERDPPARRLLEARDVAQDRGLARARWARPARTSRPRRVRRALSSNVRRGSVRSSSSGATREACTEAGRRR